MNEKTRDYVSVEDGGTIVRIERDGETVIYCDISSKAKKSDYRVFDGICAGVKERTNRSRVED